MCFIKCLMHCIYSCDCFIWFKLANGSARGGRWSIPAFSLVLLFYFLPLLLLFFLFFLRFAASAKCTCDCSSWDSAIVVNLCDKSPYVSRITWLDLTSGSRCIYLFRSHSASSSSGKERRVASIHSPSKLSSLFKCTRGQRKKERRNVFKFTRSTHSHSDSLWQSNQTFFTFKKFKWTFSSFFLSSFPPLWGAAAAAVLVVTLFPLCPCVKQVPTWLWHRSPWLSLHTTWTLPCPFFNKGKRVNTITPQVTLKSSHLRRRLRYNEYQLLVESSGRWWWWHSVCVCFCNTHRDNLRLDPVHASTSPCSVSLWYKS